MPSVYELILYETESGNRPVEDYLRNLYKENQIEDAAKIKDYMELLEKHGVAQINNYHSQAVKKVDKKNNIWELRPGDNRVFFFHFTGEKYVLLHAFRKKSQKTPPQQIEQAVREMKDYRRRN